MRMHPDAKLIELGTERDRLEALRNPIRIECNRLGDVALKEWDAAGFSSLDTKEGRKAYKDICKRVGLTKAEDDREVLDGQIEPLDDQIRALPASTVAGLKVKFDMLAHHMPAGFDDSIPRQDQDYNACLFNELGDDIKRLAAADGEPSELETAIAAFLDACRAYDEAEERGEDASEGPLWDAYVATEHAVIIYPCQTLADARLKGRFFLENDGPNDTLRNCFTGDGPALNFLLRSLLGEGGAE